MPLYDCMLLLKPQVEVPALKDLVTRIVKHVYSRNGVLAEIKSFQTVELGYGIKKLDGRYFQGQLIQMTMMATPNMNKELHYLNKEDRLLRWLLVKHRDTQYGFEYISDFGYESPPILQGDEDHDFDDEDDSEEVEEEEVEEEEVEQETSTVDQQ